MLLFGKSGKSSSPSSNKQSQITSDANSNAKSANSSNQLQSIQNLSRPPINLSMSLTDVTTMSINNAGEITQEKNNTDLLSSTQEKIISNSFSEIQTGLDRYFSINKRRRSSPNSSGNNEIKKCKSTIAKEIFPTNNRFAALAHDEMTHTERPTEETATEKTEKPPPIYLRESVSDDLLEELRVTSEGKFFIAPIKRGNINETKIQLHEIEAYRNTINLLESKNKHFYSYQLKSVKGQRVVIKGLESSININDIQEDLAAQGFQIKNIMNIRNKDKIPQPMFMVELEPASNKNKNKIFELKYVLYRRVTVEEPLKRKSLVQCFNCQEYGHTQNYCKLINICVICGDPHKTANCQKQKNNPVVRKCSNCAGNHTANYKGCPVHIELKKKLLPKQRAEQIILNKNYQSNKNFVSNPLYPGISYADAVKNANCSNTENLSNEANQLLTVIQQTNDNLLKFMKVMEANMSLMLQNMTAIMQLLMKSKP
jgi:hypothetical protein